MLEESGDNEKAVLMQKPDVQIDRLASVIYALLGITHNADRERIRQALVNMIGNAIKYSPDAESVILSSEVVNGGLTVCVRDFETGISEQSQQRVFERFFRDNELGTYSGLGLGLFISGGIIREHGGSIFVKSKKGDGSVFCFTLLLT